MARGPGRPPAWIRVLLVAIPGLLAVSGCEWILEQLPGDDDAGRRSPDPPLLSIAAAPPVEEGGDLLFAVTLSRASDVSVTARYRTEEGTARAGADYQEPVSGEVTLAPGARESVIVVRTLPDQVEEGSERFTVRLIDVANATLGTAAAAGTILGDDDTPARAIPATAGVHRTGRLETGDDVDYFKVVVRASGAVIAATDRGRAADSDNNVPDTVVRIEHDGQNDGFHPLEVAARHVHGALVTVADSGPATVYIRVSSDMATPYDLAVWVIDRQALPWFFGDAPDDPSFDIELRYVGAEPTAAQKAIIRQAADVWERVITYGIPDRFIDSSSVICDDGDPSLFGAHVDDLVVYIKVGAIDGPGGTLAQAGPCWTRLPSRLPYLGIVILDSADLTALHNAGVLRRIVTHEIGHALGFGTSWDQMAGPDGLPLLRQPSLAPDDAEVSGRDTYFSGLAAVAAFDAVGGSAYRGGAKVPVENDTRQYGAGTLDAHWRESVFDAELMTSSQLMERGTNEPLSLVTVAALDDMGYKVDYDAAEPYTLPASARAAARRSAHAEAEVYDLSGDVRQAPVMTEDPLAVPRVRLSR